MRGSAGDMEDCGDSDIEHGLFMLCLACSSRRCICCRA
jgi:hypothetical protein